MNKRDSIAFTLSLCLLSACALLKRTSSDRSIRPYFGDENFYAAIYWFVKDTVVQDSSYQVYLYENVFGQHHHDTLCLNRLPWADKEINLALTNRAKVRPEKPDYCSQIPSSDKYFTLDDTSYFDVFSSPKSLLVKIAEPIYLDSQVIQVEMGIGTMGHRHAEYAVLYNLEKRKIVRYSRCG